MNKTGRYKTLMNICGILPAVAGILIAQMTENSGFVALWLSIVSGDSGLRINTRPTTVY